jgi:hypothetical protein
MTIRACMSAPKHLAYKAHEQRGFARTCIPTVSQNEHLGRDFGSLGQYLV